MIERIAVNLVLVLLGGSMVAPLNAAENSVSQGASEGPALVEAGNGSTNAFRPVKPGPADGQIASATAYLLKTYHYLHPAFNAEVSTNFFNRYFDSYDPQHLHFLQSDLAEFERYRTNLDRLTLRRPKADTRPADEIFNRFVERLEQRVAYVDELLKKEEFAFDASERVTLSRKESPYPKDLDEAKTLWRERLRFEYLQEKLGKLDAKKKAAPSEKASSVETPVPSPAGDATLPGKSVVPKTDAEEIVETLSRRYHRNLRYFLDWDAEDVLQTYLTTLMHVYDPHSDYYGHAQAESFAISMNLSLFGIGAELRSEDGYCTILRLLPGGPAFKSQQIHEKDRIIAVAQSNQPPVDVVEMSLNKAVQLIRGPKGTEVRLTVIPAGADAASTKIVTLVRDEIPLEDQAAKAKIIELPDDRGQMVRVGVIDLPSFYFPMDTSTSNERGKADQRYTSADVALLLRKLKEENVQGVILDLRRNGGGSLEEAIKLTGLFIKEGPVVQVRGFDGSVLEQGDTDPSVVYDGPLIVLTSRFSASASEILAGALQDYGRALIVGDASTHGKGTVQQVLPLEKILRPGSYPATNDPGELKLTIRKFYRASGLSTQLEGVTPDIVLPSVVNESKDIGERALDNPLPWDTLKSAQFDRLDMVNPYLPELRNRSSQRIATDREFDYIRQDIALFKKHQADKTVSLNEQERLKEKREADARNEARDKERKARKEPQEKVYELTLKQALLPGLPSPVAKTNLAAAKVSDPKGLGTPVGGTNTTLAATGAPAATPGDAVTEDKAPAQDPVLTESKHILVDYLSLFPKGDWAAVPR